MMKLLTAIGFFQAALASAVVPIHYFPFDGNPNDVVGGAMGQITGGVTPTTGYRGGAYEFDGSTGYIDTMIDINSAVLPDLTMGAWVQTYTISAVRQAISSDNGGFDRSIGLDSRGASGSSIGWASFSGSGVLGKTPTTTFNWTFIAVSYDSSSNTTLLYTYDSSVNTVQTLTTTYSQSSGVNFTTFGRSAALNSEYFNGVIDEVFIYDQPLTVAALDEIRINGPQGVPEPSTYIMLALGGMLCALWRLRRM